MKRKIGYDPQLAQDAEWAESERSHKNAVQYHRARLLAIETGKNSLKLPQIKAAQLHRDAITAHIDAQVSCKALDAGEIDKADFPDNVEPEDAVGEVSAHASNVSRAANDFDLKLVDPDTRSFRIGNRTVVLA